MFIISEFVTFDNEIYATSLRDLSTRQMIHDGNATSCLDLTGQLGRFRTRVYTQKPADQFHVTVTKTLELPCDAVKVTETQSEADDQAPIRFPCSITDGNDITCTFSCRNKYVTKDVITMCQELIVDVMMHKTSTGAKLCSIVLA